MTDKKEKDAAQNTGVVEDVSLVDSIEIIQEITMVVGIDNGKPVVITVVDVGGNEKVRAIMDGAHPIKAEIAMKKAWTAFKGGTETVAWSGKNNPDDDMRFDMRFTDLPGGVPLINKNGVVVGGIGVSGREGMFDDCKDPHSDHGLAKFGRAKFRAMHP